MKSLGAIAADVRVPRLGLKLSGGARNNCTAQFVIFGQPSPIQSKPATGTMTLLLFGGAIT